MDVSGAVPMSSGADLERWLASRAATERAVIVAIYKKASGKQTVTLEQLQEAALCFGWVDTLTQRIDDERYAIRFVPRRPGSNWGEGNREMARRLLAERRIQPEGMATLPEDP